MAWKEGRPPRGTPAAAISRIQSAVAKLLQTPEMQTAFERVGTYVVVTNPKAFGEYLEIEFGKWGKVVREVNLQIN